MPRIHFAPPQHANSKPTCVLTALLLTISAVVSSSALAQENKRGPSLDATRSLAGSIPALDGIAELKRAVPRPITPPPVDQVRPRPCPYPVTLTETAPPPVTATVDGTQLPPSLISPTNPEPNFGGTTPDKVFRHTFQFKVPNNQCCQCTNARLILKFKALLPALDPTHSQANASNDKWYIYKDKNICGQMYGWIYDNPTNQGGTVTKVINIPCNCLKRDGNTVKLTFVTQDDTSVTSAQAQINGCCVKQDFGSLGARQPVGAEAEEPTVNLKD